MQCTTKFLKEAKIINEAILFADYDAMLTDKLS